MKPYAEKFYLSPAWKRCRASFMKNKFYICERCGGAATIAHHKIYLNPNNINNPIISLSWSNLEALCQDCHNKEHMKGEVTAAGLIFDEDGNLIQGLPG